MVVTCLYTFPQTHRMWSEMKYKLLALGDNDVSNIPLWPAMLVSGEAACVCAADYRGTLCPSTQFCFESKTALRYIKSLKKKKRVLLCPGWMTLV